MTIWEVSEPAKAFLIEQGYDEAMGARPLRRVIEQQIRDKVTDFYLDNIDVCIIFPLISSISTQYKKSNRQELTVA